MNALALVSGSWPAAEDAVQEALARAWERTERGMHIESLRPWVATVAGNLLRDRFRRLRAERRARDRLGVWRAGGERTPVSAAEDRVDLGRALAGLPRREREVAVFRYYLDLEVTEVAAVLRIPEGTAKSRLHRARRALAEALGEAQDQEDEHVV